MSEFVKYQHVERLGTSETEGIELGTVHVFPKIDGSNACIWFDGTKVRAASRKRELSLQADNAGFLEWVYDNRDRFECYFSRYGNHRLFGEWLVPHSLKTYREDSWRKFYVFDVGIYNEAMSYFHYDDYCNSLVEFEIDYIPPICVYENPSTEQIIGELRNNTFLIEDGKGAGEGIVIKNYQWKNKYGRQTWAKVVTSEFKAKHTREMGPTVKKGKSVVEDLIVKKYATKAMCDKVYNKICVEEDGWSSRFIPRLLNTVYYDLVREESWNFVKHFKNPVIDFRKLQQYTYQIVKIHLPDLF